MEDAAKSSLMASRFVYAPGDGQEPIAPTMSICATVHFAMSNAGKVWGHIGTAVPVRTRAMRMEHVQRHPGSVSVMSGIMNGTVQPPQLRHSPLLGR